MTKEITWNNVIKEFNGKVHYLTKPIKFGAKNYLTNQRREYLISLGITDSINQSIIQYAFNAFVQFENKDKDEQDEILAEFKKPYYFSYDEFKYVHGIQDLKSRLEEISETLCIELIDYEDHKFCRTLDLDNLIQELKKIKVQDSDFNFTSEIKSSDAVASLRQSDDDCPEEISHWLNFMNSWCATTDYGYQIQKLKELNINEDRKMIWINGFLLKPRFFCSNNSMRCYDDFAQTIPRDIKEIIFPRSENYYDLDIKASHLSILFSLSPKLKSKVAANYRDQIIQETGLSRKTVKSILNAVIYGCGDKKILIKGYCTQEELDIINKNEKYITIKSELNYILDNVLMDKIKELNVKLPVIKKKTSPYGIKQKYLSHLMGHIERTSLCSSDLIKLLVNNKDCKRNIKVILDLHDGLLIKASSKEAFKKYYPMIKRIVDSKFKLAGVKTELIYK